MLIKYMARRSQDSALGRWLAKYWRKIWTNDDFRLPIIALLPFFSLGMEQVFLKFNV